LAYVPIGKNGVESTLAAAFTYGTSSVVGCADISHFTAPNFIYIDDGAQHVLLKYTAKDDPNNELETLTDAQAVYKSAGADGHTFPIGTVVQEVLCREHIEPLITDIIGAAAGAVFYEDSDTVGNSANFTYNGTNVTLLAGSLGVGVAPTNRLETLGGDVYFKRTDDTIFLTLDCAVAAGDKFASLRFMNQGVAKYAFTLQQATGDWYVWDYVESTYVFQFDQSETVLKLLPGGGVVSIGGAAKGTNFSKGLALAAGTDPTTSPADVTQLWSKDVNAAAGYAWLHGRDEKGHTLIVAGIALKTDTGRSANPHEGLMEINTHDNLIAAYADGGWRTLVSW